MSHNGACITARPLPGPSLAILVALAAVLAGIYCLIAILSFHFSPTATTAERPILAVLAALGLGFVAYIIAIWVAVRARQDKRLLAAIVLGSVLFRGLSIYSWPILEIDVYRYLWDGNVTLSGVSPYRYSPAQVRSARPGPDLPADLAQLVRIRDDSPAVEMILSQVHYGELPTIYPPVSQAVFAGVAYLTPRAAGVLDRIVAMKAAFVLFDLATLSVVISLLRFTGKHVGWAVAYGWCPLVVKEIANTGHLDPVAVFLTTLALYFLVRLHRASSIRQPVPRFGVTSAVVLALAVGAKLYPLVLAPLFVAGWLRSFGWRVTIALVLVLAAVATAACWPMIPPSRSLLNSSSRSVTDGADDVTLPLSADPASIQPQNPAGGLAAFLGRWEMNDFLFLLVVENLKLPAEGLSQRAWFAIVPNSRKTELLAVAGKSLGADPSRAAFQAARLLTAFVFIVLLAMLVWRVRHSPDPATWLRGAFLILAGSWLLSPTQNPWYWIWALPLVAFAHCKAWLAVSGLVMVYYLRFWLTHRWPDTPVPGSRYAGAEYFDFVVTWLEYGPWLLCLSCEAVWRRFGRLRSVERNR